MRINNRRMTNTEITYSVQGKDPKGGKYVRNRFHYFSKLIRGIFMLRREQDSDQPCPKCKENPGNWVCNCKVRVCIFLLDAHANGRAKNH